MRPTTDATERAQRRAQERERERTSANFASNKNAQASYGAQLRGLARQISRIIQAFAPETKKAPFEPGDVARIEQALARYAEAITPWARATALRMVGEVNRRNKTSWQRYTERMGSALRLEIQNAPVGTTIEALLAEQVDYITSLPWDAARHVQERVLAALSAGTRPGAQEAEIREALEAAHPEATESWLMNRATLIARTETARAASLLTQARATHIGSTTYTWKTAGDWKVREGHRRCAHEDRYGLGIGRYRWDTPPESDPPYHSHPGQIWNCRCVAIPDLPSSG